MNNEIKNDAPGGGNRPGAGNKENKNTLHQNCSINQPGGTIQYSPEPFYFAEIYDLKSRYYASLAELTRINAALDQLGQVGEL